MNHRFDLLCFKIRSLSLLAIICFLYYSLNQGIDFIVIFLYKQYFYCLNKIRKSSLLLSTWHQSSRFTNLGFFCLFHVEQANPCFRSTRFCPCCKEPKKKGKEMKKNLTDHGAIIASAHVIHAKLVGRLMRSLQTGERKEEVTAVHFKLVRLTKRSNLPQVHFLSLRNNSTNCTNFLSLKPLLAL